MIKFHITEILHDPYAMEMIDKVALIIQLMNNHSNLMEYRLGEEEGCILLMSLQLMHEKNKILDGLEENYTVISSLPHQIKLKKAWETFKRDGNKESLLKVLIQADEATVEEPSPS